MTMMVMMMIAIPQAHPHLDDDHDEDVINPVKEIDGEKF